MKLRCTQCGGIIVMDASIQFSDFLYMGHTQEELRKIITFAETRGYKTEEKQK